METPGFSITIHGSLTKPMLIAGAPRQFTILNAVILAAFLLGLHSLLIIPVCIVLQLCAMWLTKRDPYGFQIILRHIRQKNYYRV